jgi:hypothetical protein
MISLSSEEALFTVILAADFIAFRAAAQAAQAARDRHFPCVRTRRKKRQTAGDSAASRLFQSKESCRD